MKKWILRLVILGLIGGASYAGFVAFKNLPKEVDSIATTKVRRGDVIVKSFARGELRAVRSATLTAPNLFGTVQVTKLAPLGAFAREKDLVVEFDDSEVQSRVEEKQLELDQIDEQIKKAQADVAIRNNQDQVELLQARFSVRRAELEVKRNELISAIDAQKNKLTLEESKRRLQQLESDVKSRQEQAQAEIAVLREKKNKGNLEMARERSRLMQVKLLSPISGLVAVRQNRGNFMFPGMQVPDIREGDQVQPGIPVADILDLSEMEIIAKVGELDRANLREGQEAVMSLDALPEKKLKATIKTLSGTASANVFSFDPAKKFDVVFNIDMRELLTALGAKPDQIGKILATAEANRRKRVTSVPAGAGLTMAMGGGGVPDAAGGMGGAGAGLFQPPGAAADPAAAGAGGGRRNRGGGGDAAGGGGQQKKSGGGAGARETASAAGSDGARPQGDAAAGGGEGRRRRQGGGGPPMLGIGGFTAAELDAAKLPLPPEQDTQFDVLLRPGLLADVEIIVEKVPDAINVPMQAVFELEGKTIVYVKTAKGFEPRVIKPLKRSETVMTIAEGVKPGEIVALADPNAKKSDKKEKGGGGGGGPMGALPGGKS
jgi:hypothetical protein